MTSVNPFNSVQIAMLRHLTDKNSSERLDALGDLVERCAMHTSQDSDWTKEIIQKYLGENPRGFCADGIQRFRDALGLPVPKPKVTKAKIEVELELTGEWHAFMPGCDAATDVENALLSTDFALYNDIHQPTGPYAVTKATIVKGEITNGKAR